MSVQMRGTRMDQHDESPILLCHLPGDGSNPRTSFTWINIEWRIEGMVLPYMKVRSRSDPEGNSVNLIIEAGNPHLPISEARIHAYIIQYPLGRLAGAS